MKISKILSTVGTGLIKTFVPGAAAVIDTVNAFLPEDKKLSENATGAQAIEAINSLPPAQQAEVLSKQCDVEIAAIQGHTNVIKALSEADMSGSSTRPYIAKCMCFVVCYTVIALVSAIVYAIIADKPEIITAIANAWPLVLAMLATPIALLKAYFGLRSEDKKMRANAALGVPVSIPAAGMISSAVKKIF